MRPIPVERIVEVSSEHSDHKAFTLITGFGDWTTDGGGVEKAELTLKLSELVELARVDIANENSAWVDIRVWREGTTPAPLLPTICLQSRKDSKDETNARSRRTLESENFNEDVRSEKFDHVKIICRQPFNRMVRFGLSHLKFFTYPKPETNNDKSKPNQIPSTEEDDVVLNIVGNKENDNSNELAASAIKNAQFHDVNRAKRFVNTPLNDGDVDPTETDNELRPKQTPSRFLSALLSELKTSPVTTPASSRNSFIFAPKTSSKEQEERIKRAAEAADKVIPGRSPKKKRITSEVVDSPTNAATSSRRSDTVNRKSEVEVSFKQDSKKPPKVFALKVTVAEKRTSSRAEKNYHEMSSSDDEGKTVVARRVTPPLSRAARSLQQNDPEEHAPPKKKRSVAVSPFARGESSFSSNTNSNKKKKKTSEILDRIFSSDEEEQHCRPSREKENKRTENESKKSNEQEDEELKTKEPHITLTDSDDGKREVKAEVHSDGDDVPVVIKQEIIDLGDSEDDSKTTTSASTKKKKNRNPPMNCEVESDDSDLEVVGNKLMQGVVFALSGFKNPYRSSLRSMAISMGARYRADWDNSCTHLVCAFKNTPKYNEVRRMGGKIVTAAWIATSHLKQKLANWKNYRLE